MHRQRLETLSLATHLLHVSLELLSALNAAKEDGSTEVDVGSLSAKLQDVLRDLQVFLGDESSGQATSSAGV